MNPATEHRKLAAIMFTDMVGYSALAQRNESLAIELLEEQRRLLRSRFGQFNGVEVDCAGDGFFVEFASALEATRCAIAIQQAIVERNSAAPADKRFQIRIGIHVGDVVHRDDKVMGDAVNITARIEPLAEPGGICISEAVAQQVQNKIDHALVRLGRPELKNIELPLVRLGEPELKNIEVPVVVYKVVLDDHVAADVRRREGLRVTGPSRENAARNRWRTAFALGVFVLIVLNVFLFPKFGLRSTSSSSPDKIAGRITSLALRCFVFFKLAG